MKAVALGIGRLIWCRNQRGFIATAVSLAVLAIACQALFAYSRDLPAIVASTIPLIVIFSYILNSCLFVQEPGSMDSGYPRPLFVLPARNAALVFWPMFYGCTIVALLWIVTAGVIYRWSGFRLPVWLPALALAALMGWLQGMAWMPLAARWLRLIVVIATTSALAAVPIYLIRMDLSTSWLLFSLFSAYLAVAFLVGLASVATDRRGDSWLRKPASLQFGPAPGGPVRVADRRPFRSIAAAQFWFEWTSHGLDLPLYLGPVFCLIWTILLVSRRSPYPSSHLGLILGLLAALSLILPGAIGPALARFRPFWAGAHGFITFLAVRPMTSSQMLLAKLRMVLLSVILTAAFAVAGTGVWIFASNNFASAASLGHDLATRFPGGRGVLVLTLALVLFPAIIVKQITDGFACVLSGRRWIADAAAWFYAVAVFVLVTAGAWLAAHPDSLPRLLAILPWLVVGAAIIKGTVAVAIFRSVVRRRLIDWPGVATVLGVWLTFTGIAVALAILVSPADAISVSPELVIPMSKPLLILGIATFGPLLRFPLSTIALEWNRHR